MIDAVVFDFDGLIFDSETHEYETVRELLAEHGGELTLDVWSDCVGRAPGWFDPYAHLEEQIGSPVDRAALEEVRSRRYLERISGEGPIATASRACTNSKNLFGSAKR